MTSCCRLDLQEIGKHQWCLQHAEWAGLATLETRRVGPFFSSFPPDSFWCCVCWKRHISGVASLKFKVRTQTKRKPRRLIRACAVCQDKHTLGNGRLWNLYMIRPSIGGCLCVIPTSSEILSKLGFWIKEITIGFTRTFCTHNIKNPSELW